MRVKRPPKLTYTAKMKIADLCYFTDVIVQLLLTLYSALNKLNILFPAGGQTECPGEVRQTDLPCSVSVVSSALLSLNKIMHISSETPDFCHPPSVLFVLIWSEEQRRKLHGLFEMV